MISLGGLLFTERRWSGVGVRAGGKGGGRETEERTRSGNCSQDAIYKRVNKKEK